MEIKTKTTHIPELPDSPPPPFPVDPSTSILWLQEGESFKPLAVVRDKITTDLVKKAVQAALEEGAERATDPADVVLANQFKAHGNSRQMMCIAVNHEIYDAYVQFGGRNGRKALPITTTPKMFVSETEASLHIGCLNHEVAQRLGTAKHSGKTEATVRGATFCYADDFGGLD